jgi:hypothetical protein
MRPPTAADGDRPAGEQGRTCPSAACHHEGTAVLGVMTGSGRLAYLPMPVPVDEAFAAALAANGRPENRYRFSAPCVQDRCPQWTGSGCGVIDHLLDDPADGAGGELPAGDPPLPACGIRRTCRWYAQRGAAACAVCPGVVADIGGTATYSSEPHEGH